MFKGYAKEVGYPNEEGKYVPSCYNFSGAYSNSIESFFLIVAIISTIGFIVSLFLESFAGMGVFVPIMGGTWTSFIFNKIISRKGKWLNNAVYKNYIIPIEATYQSMLEHDKKVYAPMLVEAYGVAEKCNRVSNMSKKEKEAFERLAGLFLRRVASGSESLLEKIKFENRVIDNSERSITEAMDWNKNV